MSLVYSKRCAHSLIFLESLPCWASYISLLEYVLQVNDDLHCLALSCLDGNGCWMGTLDGCTVICVLGLTSWMGTGVDRDSWSLGGWILDSSSSDDSELSGKMIWSLGFFFSDLVCNDGFTALRLCYNHVQLWALSSYSGCIAALQLNSGHASLTLVTVVQIYLC